MNALLQQLAAGQNPFAAQQWANSVNNGWQQALLGQSVGAQSDYPFYKADTQYDIAGLNADLGRYQTKKQYNLGKYQTRQQRRMNEDNNDTRRYGIDARRDTVGDFLPLISGLVNRPQGGASFKTDFGAGGTASLSRLLGG